MRWLDYAKDNWLFIGDSTTAQVDHSVNDSGPGMCWPTLLMEIGNNRLYHRPINTAHSGFSAVTLNDQAYYRIVPFKPYGRATSAQEYIGAGINDLILNNQTASTTFGFVTNMWRISRTNGFIVNAFTLSTVSTNLGAATAVQSAQFDAVERL